MRDKFVRIAVTTAAILTAGLAASGQVYEFTADYCGACRTMEPVISQLVQQGYPIVAIDVGQQPELAKQYGVAQIPCFLAVRDGQEVGRALGTITRDELVRLCELTVASRRNQPSFTAKTHDRDGIVCGNVCVRRKSRIVSAYRVPAIVTTMPRRPNVEIPTAATQIAASKPPSGISATQAVANSPKTSSAAGVGVANMGVATDPFAKAMAATVRLRIEDETGHSFGTGTIIDVHNDEALILTCGHIFRDSGGKGRIDCELFCPNAPATLEGKVICYDLRRDVGLVSIKPGVPVPAVSVGGTGQRPRAGEAVFSLGCDRGADPTMNKNKILAVNRYHGPANLVVGGKPVDGRSGGGLFTSDGILIGVCNAADHERDEGLYAALGPIHAELDRSGLGFIYRGQQPAIASRDGSIRGRGAKTSRAEAEVVLGAVVPISTNAADLPQEFNGPRSTNPAGNSPQTALSSGQGSIGGTELICVVRDASDAEGRGRVFVIDRPSPELVRHLSNELNRRGPHRPTQLREPEDVRTLETNGWQTSGGE